MLQSFAIQKCYSLTILDTFSICYHEILDWKNIGISLLLHTYVLTYYLVLTSYRKNKVDSYSKWIRQKCYQYFINKKLKKPFYFLSCILPNYVPHEITKEFWKKNKIKKDLVQDRDLMLLKTRLRQFEPSWSNLSQL